MKTDCNQEGFGFQDLISRKVQAQFDNHHVSSDAGGLLIGQLDRSFGFTKRFAAHFRDRRDPRFIEHEVLGMLRQRVYGLALGYEDINDHDTLRTDPLIATVCGHDDPEGKERRHPQDKGKPLAGKSTLNRMELKARKGKDGKYPCCLIAVASYQLPGALSSPIVSVCGGPVESTYSW